MMLCRSLFPILSIQGSGCLPGARVSATMCSMVFRTRFIDNTQRLRPFASVSYRASLYLSWKMISVRNDVYLSLSIQFVKPQLFRKRDTHNFLYNFTVFYYTFIYLICVRVCVHARVCVPMGWHVCGTMGSWFSPSTRCVLETEFRLSYLEAGTILLFPIFLVMAETARC